VLLEHAHAAGIPPLGPLGVARVHGRHSPREIYARGQRRK
jgi:hypothetical protein